MFYSLYTYNSSQIPQNIYYNLKFLPRTNRYDIIYFKIHNVLKSYNKHNRKYKNKCDNINNI